MFGLVEAQRVDEAPCSSDGIHRWGKPQPGQRLAVQAGLQSGIDDQWFGNILPGATVPNIVMIDPKFTLASLSIRRLSADFSDTDSERTVCEAETCALVAPDADLHGWDAAWEQRFRR